MRVRCLAEKNRDCEFTKWVDMACELPEGQTCGAGQQHKVRSIASDPMGEGLGCGGSLKETIQCFVPCEDRVDCQLQEWGSWSGCSTCIYPASFWFSALNFCFVLLSFLCMMYPFLPCFFVLSELNSVGTKIQLERQLFCFACLARIAFVLPS